MSLDKELGDSSKKYRANEENYFCQIVREVEEILVKEESAFMFKQAVELASDYGHCIYYLADRREHENG